MAHFSYYFSMVFNHSVFRLYPFYFLIFIENSIFSIVFDCYFVLVYYPTSCWYSFLSLFWNVLFYLYCSTLSQYLLNLFPFASIFWFISSCCAVCGCLFTVFSFHLVLRYFTLLSSFVCCCSLCVLLASLFIQVLEFPWDTYFITD